MPVNTGYNLTQSLLDLHARSDASREESIFKHTEENDRNVANLEKLKNLLATLQNRREEGKALDFTHDEEARALLNQVREIAPHLIQQGTYRFEEKKIDSLIEGLRDECQFTSARLQPKMMQINELMQERNRIVEIVGHMIKMYREECAHSINKIGR